MQLKLQLRNLSITVLIALIFILSECLPVYSTFRGQRSFSANISARSEGDIVLRFSSLPGGMARGEKLRITLGNLLRLEGREQNPVEVRASVKLLDSLGRTISQTAEVLVPLGRFRSFDFNRDSLSPAGDPGTGRLQAVDQLTVRCIGVNSAEAFEIQQKILDFLPGTSELIDNVTGKSRTTNSCFPLSTGFNMSLLPRLITTGLANGQTLRLTILNLASSLSSEIQGRISVTDQNGTLIAQSNEVTIESSEFHSFDFNRVDIPLRGESGTGRLQVAWVVETGVNAEVPLAVSIEVIESASGISSSSRVAYSYVAVPLNQG